MFDLKQLSLTQELKGVPSVWLVSGLFGLLVIYVSVIPSPIESNFYIYPKPLPVLEGALQRNNLLQKANKLFEGQLLGPESITAGTNGILYTGAQDGRILAFNNTHLWTVTRTGQEVPGCGSFEMEPVCGRPKGLKVNRDGDLLVLDAYFGLLKVNISTGQIETLLSSDIGIEGVPFSFLNSLDISRSGLVYFTDSTTRWGRRHYRYEVMEVNALGRLIEYNPETKTARLLLGNLHLANGIALSQDETFILIAEMSVCRLRRLYLKGPKAGQTDIFADNLPGYPDNIKINSHGNFYVGLGAVRYEGVSKIGPFLDLVGPFPGIKNFIAKVTPLFLFDLFVPRHAIVLEFSPEGKVVTSLHDPTGGVTSAVGEAYEHQGYIYLAHFKSTFIGQIDIRDI
ncbi:adipocyte plasma membrane-associated protein-like [Mizuhopecten yessoensis]|uniref:adipocyte plasma membrane-associated protein-like n=1 Tax=Mizuhopecten yessoensis TaxID=6573 RepID=UPI000B45A24D|nr:adipocyte plasma membrane-associated protein-like [Mizuhopecten yessoensis]XP_021370257.1 adipocyte plasma membrane-associated protein-like [Mizuhopecten yessoensis]